MAQKRKFTGFNQFGHYMEEHGGIEILLREWPAWMMTDSQVRYELSVRKDDGWFEIARAEPDESGVYFVHYRGHKMDMPVPPEDSQSAALQMLFLYRFDWPLQNGIE